MSVIEEGDLELRSIPFRRTQKIESEANKLRHFRPVLLELVPNANNDKIGLLIR